MFLARGSKDWGGSRRIVGVELDIKELGEVWWLKMVELATCTSYRGPLPCHA